MVEVADWEWGSALAEASCGLVLKGANENMGVKRDFKKICKHVLELLAPGPMKIGDIHVHSRSAAGDRGMEIVDKALADLVLSEEIEESTPSKGAARPPDGMVSVEVMISEKEYLISDKGVGVSGGRQHGRHGTPPPLSDIKRKIKKINK